LKGVGSPGSSTGQVDIIRKKKTGEMPVLYEKYNRRTGGMPVLRSLSHTKTTRAKLRPAI
jgi:hypothetical protein